jgi:transcriptional regulator of arginine metabolism
MTIAKNRRQRAISQLIRENAFASQEELATLLSARGFAATQATISRDLEQIGAVKVRRGGQSSYALPEQIQTTPPSRLAALFDEFVRSVLPAGNLLVVKTPPGSAHMIGVALDQSGFAEIVGTICGDDTVFIACETPSAARRLEERINGVPVEA